MDKDVHVPPRTPRMKLNTAYIYPYIRACIAADEYNTRIHRTPTRIIERIRRAIEMDPSPGMHRVKNIGGYFCERSFMRTDEWQLFAAELATCGLMVTHVSFESPNTRVPRTARDDLLVYVYMLLTTEEYVRAIQEACARLARDEQMYLARQ
jgi:hypothetical protein